MTEYVPENREQADIKSLLIQYRNAKNNFNLEQYLACLHDNGKYTYKSRRIVSKEQLKKELPVFWAGVKSGDQKFYPISRESLNGNYFRSGQFINPKIRVSKNTAEVTVTFTKWTWRLKHYISMVKENGHWLINRLDWEPG
ncbi:MAG: nuclear transport factor 2 family protein [Desulfobacterales bacterium]|nr:nuclear transport factor 2 family protein [Desulfobacterales bacterium]